MARAKRWGLWLLVVVLVAGSVLYALNAAVGLESNRLWFGSLHLGDVYSTILGSQILLFCLFGGVAALAGGASVLAVRHYRPARGADPETQKWRSRFQRHDRQARWLLVALAVLLPLVKVGGQAAGRWQAFLLWRHATPWGEKDAHFHRDLSYFIEVYPFHRMTVNLLQTAVVWAFVATLVAAYLYSAVRIRGTGPRVSRPIKAQLSLLGAAWLVLQAAGYWLDRLAVATSQRGAVTGPSYTDLHAVLPGKSMMIVVALLVAALLVANIFLKRGRIIWIGVGVMVFASLVITTGRPALVQRFREQPSAATLELPHIERNIAATRSAYGIDDQVTAKTYDTSTGNLKGDALLAQATKGAQVRLLDPNRLSPTFNVKQQLQAYYGFKSTLDIDRYPLGDAATPRDVAIAVRELRVNGISRSSWANSHLVYTHGYGLVAAPTDTLSSKTDVPEFLDGGLPPGQQIPVTEPRVYFGQNSPSYSIVGQPEGSTKKLEFDHPSADGANASVHNTYDGGGGVPLDSTLHRLVYAAQLRSPNIVFSKEVNDGSRILTVRDPRARVAKVAPWLTLDSTVYPTVVDGHIIWVVDGYTTTSNYPESQLVNLRQATNSTLSSSSSVVRQPSRPVNYMRNSVKATVDAYTGEVTLYEWNTAAEPDPLLKTWEAAFPGLVHPQSDIPASLLPHLRYPQNLFDVQRQVLARYHVTDAADFYSGNDFWKVPSDPTVAANQQLNAGTATAKAAPTQPSVYMSLSADGFGQPGFSLSSPLVTLNGRNLAGFLSVNSEPGPDYGKFTLLKFPPGASAESPAQIQNDIESTTDISEALTLQRGGNSKVVLGNLLAIPVGGKMLYVEPVYTQAKGGNSFPIMRHVIASYGDGEPAFQSDLVPALREALRGDGR